MSRKKRSRSILYIFIVVIAAAVLLWGKATPGGSVLTSMPRTAIDSLMIVKVPESIPQQMMHYRGFDVCFNADAHQPNYAVWELTASEARANEVSRKGFNFQPDPAVQGCAQLDDYRRSGYTRGHMIPAADAKWSEGAMHDTFYLTNVSPQTRELNSGAWSKLEDKCRDWAKRDSSLIIITGPVLTDKVTRTIGPSEVPVPERFFKVILAPHAQPMRAIAFIMPNGRVPGGMQAAAVSVDEVERVTGLDFFSSLPDDTEARIESQCDFVGWSVR